MIKIGSLRGMSKTEYDENWMIVRSAKSVPDYAIQVVDLSPSKDLFYKYLRTRDNNQFDAQWFETVYAPQFITELKANEKAMQLLQTLASESKTKNIYLCCFCTNETLCHRSIIAGILQGMNADIKCNDYIKYWHKFCA